VVDLPQREETSAPQSQEKPVAQKEEGRISASSVSSNRFYSPLVRNMAREEGISQDELAQISGTGKEGRVTKKDMLNYLHNRPAEGKPQIGQVQISGPAEIIEMDRMRKMIASRMIESKRISAHVTSFVEADVTNLVHWRERIKDAFKQREGESFTFTPLFIEAVAKALKEYPMINISVDGDRIIQKKDFNVGMAVALPNGNLIVPVIKNADQMSLTALSKKVNNLAVRARDNQLKADDLADGTYTISNIGAFGNIMGTPIIVQPQVAILALGTIVKKPAVIETPQGDAIAIRHKIYLSHSYDHRVVDGALGGMFVKRVAELLENFDTSRTL
jgi:2-oxoglutarate dehydrogenase E2 component (dihydrolipoamide succinyltransferase)